ncbi:RNA-binding protein [Eubacterium oxidoreducens]|uniref:RNA-binding protein YlmH, contains S4-like domain n=1 Tax=Eubacterium oxidoreducens TaxID=1732 RepID=A0A1G6AMA3_EUBOX|nr:YlmH/Sll1252 family protein [Eubacterium oxidoreducens]SDB09283.1 RNA-binding protein YlmH, contains S4-like domain [Eubacterium oxidoreducens]
MNEDIRFLLKRLQDLSRRAQEYYETTYSDFLNLNELSFFLQNKNEICDHYKLFGGYEKAERQMIAFIPDALSFDENDSFDYPIICIKVEPKNKKFAESLSHRDFLGALMHLGITRNQIGDILVSEDGAYVFCQKHICDFIMGELKKIRHTNVKCSIYNQEISQFAIKTKTISKTVTSMRLDCIIAALLGTSRTMADHYIKSELTFVNSVCVEKSTYKCNEGDVISVRGYGKYSLIHINGISKKGKLKLVYEKYI